MGVFRVPRATTSERMSTVLQQAEIVYDVDLNSYFGGDGSTLGGFDVGSKFVASPVLLHITLTPTDITNKSITLPSAPAYPSSVSFLPDGGPHQRYGVDYSVSGSILSWDGLGLENFLESGETITVTY